MSQLARRIDPISSHEAAAEVEAEGTQIYQQLQTLRMVALYGAGTRAEIAIQNTNDHMAKRKGRHSYDFEYMQALTNQTKVMMGRRLPELAKNGLIELVEIRRCTIANRKSQVWRCTAIGLAACEQ